MRHGPAILFGYRDLGIHFHSECQLCTMFYHGRYQSKIKNYLRKMTN